MGVRVPPSAPILRTLTTRQLQFYASITCIGFWCVSGVNEDEVVIYNDGRGGERAAIKVRVPIHSDFYRDSIVVVRVADQFDETVVDGQHNAVNTDIIN